MKHSRTTRNNVRIALGTLAIALVPSAALAAPDRLRIGTINLGLLDSPFGFAQTNYGGCGESFTGAVNGECIADKMAARVLKGDYDVIVFNEVFDEDAVEVLRSKLGKRFPHQVFNAWTNKVFGVGNNSGLAIFSRFPFATPTSNRNYACSNPGSAMETDQGYWYRPDLANVNDPPSPGNNRNVGFNGFAPPCVNGSWDCYATKGVLFAEIQRGTQKFHIFATHMQADEGLSTLQLTAPAHKAQLQQIADFANCISPGGILSGTPHTIVLGDINVDGNLANNSSGAHTTGDTVAFNIGHNRAEWDEFFNPNLASSVPFFTGDFLNGGRVMDGWLLANTDPGWFTSVGDAEPRRSIDQGITHGHDKRFDYIRGYAPTLEYRLIFNG